MICHQRAGLDQPRCGERLGGDQHARSENEAPRCGIGLAHDGGADLQDRFADLDPLADRQTEPAEDGGIDRRSVTAVARAERGVEALGWREDNRTVERVSRIDGLQLDQTAPGAVLGARHCPHRCGFGNRAAVCQEFPFVDVRLTVG